MKRMWKRAWLVTALSLVLLLAAACTSPGTPTMSQLTPSSAPTQTATDAPQATPAPTQATGAPAGTRSNPLPIGVTGLFDGTDEIVNTFKVELTLTEVIRGDEALQMAKAANEFNDDPPEGKEYLFAKFKVKGLASTDDAVIDVNNAKFDLVSSSGTVYDDFVSVAGLTPSLGDLYAGGEKEGYAYFYVDENDAAPTIVFLDYIHEGLWFTTDPDAKLAEGSQVYTPEAGADTPTQAPSGRQGTRTNPIPAGTTGTYDGTEEVVNAFKVDMTVTEVIRGDSALQMAKAANRFNEDPPEGMEYLFVKFKVKALEGEGDDAIDINNAQFDLISSGGVKYDDFVSVAGLEPKFTEMYPGAEIEGFAYFYVAVEDESPTVVFLDYINDGLWFAIQ